MARGLVENWKWPVFVHHDFTIEDEDLMQIIIALEAEYSLESFSVCCD